MWSGVVFWALCAAASWARARLRARGAARPGGGGRMTCPQLFFDNRAVRLGGAARRLLGAAGGGRHRELCVGGALASGGAFWRPGDAARALRILQQQPRARIGQGGGRGGVFWSMGVGGWNGGPRRPWRARHSAAGHRAAVQPSAHGGAPRRLGGRQPSVHEPAPSSAGVRRGGGATPPINPSIQFFVKQSI